MHTLFWMENLNGRAHSEDQGVYWDNIRMYLTEIR